jgi:outer membrane protein assembly factor BamB
MPQHRVRITNPFYIGMYEVTQAEYERVFPGRKSFFRWPDGDGKDRVKGMNTSKFPAELVKWVDAVEFCRKLSEMPREKKAGRAYRLPTEAEWEYACRAGTQTAFHFGDSLDSNQANFLGTFPFGDAEKGPFRNRTTAAGLFKPNAFGLYDMHGNVWEWCLDWYGRDYYKDSSVDDPQGPASGTRKVIRGGDWYSDGRDCRTAFRYAGLTHGMFYATGMRIVMTLGDASGDSTPTSLTAGPTTPDIKAELATNTEANFSDTAGEDWPRWRGPRGDGTWHGPKLPQRWPDGGLRRVWRQPVGGGYGGVAVAQGRVYVMDRQKDAGEFERLVCFNAATGELIWEHRFRVNYKDVAYGNGPRTTPAIFDSRVYILGATGQLRCLNAETGTRIWSTELVIDHQARIPIWGFCASPFVFDDLLIVHAGAEPDGCLIAFNRRTGKKVWSSLSDPAGYATPIVAAIDGKQQLVCWTPTHVRSVDARSGEPLWSVPYKVDSGMSIAMPICQEGIVLVSGYYDGTKAIRVGDHSSHAEVIWEDRRNLRGHMAQPLYRDRHVYLLDKRHGLTCFELATGKKLWDAENRVTAKARNPQATLVWLGDEDRALILNSDGDLILARLNPSGYTEQSRTNIIGETWAHPAYAGTRVYARSDSELVCLSLTEAPTSSQ